MVWVAADFNLRTRYRCSSALLGKCILTSKNISITAKYISLKTTLTFASETFKIVSEVRVYVRLPEVFLFLVLRFLNFRCLSLRFLNILKINHCSWQKQLRSFVWVRQSESLVLSERINVSSVSLKEYVTKARKHNLTPTISGVENAQSSQVIVNIFQGWYAQYNFHFLHPF